MFSIIIENAITRVQLSQMDETIQIPVVMGLNNHCYLSGLKNTS